MEQSVAVDKLVCIVFFVMLQVLIIDIFTLSNMMYTPDTYRVVQKVAKWSEVGK